MTFNHNDYYHPLLLRDLPRGTRRALDVGCGTGLLARRFAASGVDVHAIDPDERVIRVAGAIGSPGPGAIDYQVRSAADPLPDNGYDVITCVASAHHLPSGTIASLREALRPGGVLLVLGLARPRAARDWAAWLVAAPILNLMPNAITIAAERLAGGDDHQVPFKISENFPTMTEVRRESARLLPGSSVRTLVFWRYLLRYRKPL